MWDVRVCAACLATGVRMHSMSAANLLEPYQLLTGIELESEGMPRKLCWECAALVHKFNMFRHKCETASLLLQDIYNQHDEVSEQDVLRINREHHNLISSYSICPIVVYHLSSPKTNKTCQKDKTTQMEKSNNKQTGNVPMEPFVKFEHEIIKTEEVPIEIKSEVDDTELTDDVIVAEDCSQPVQLESLAEDCSQPVQLESPQKIKPVRKRRQGLNLKRERARKKAKEFGMTQKLLSQEQQMDVMRERRNNKVYKSTRFPCTLCYNPFNRETTFNNHKLKHEPISGEFMCDICKLRYKTRLKLLIHISRFHMYKYSCRSCPDVFYNRSAAQKHYAWHKGVVYTCHICKATFNKQTTQLNHLRIKHPSEHVCDQCGAPFHSKKGLHQHINYTHKLKRDTFASGGDHETSGPYCVECDIQFTCQQAWTRHVLVSPKHEYERHIYALGCEDCGEILSDEKSLRAHRATHRPVQTTMAKPPTCEQCGEVMESHRAYHAHFRRVHPDKTRTHYPRMLTPCMCEVCGKVFQSKGHLKEHSYKHQGERRRYKCDVCGKMSMTKESLKMHIRTHTKETPCKCDICGRGFSRPGNLQRHKTIHSDATPYECDICGKCFKKRENMKSHVEYVHKKKPWPKRDRSKRQNGNERGTRGEKSELL